MRKDMLSEADQFDRMVTEMIKIGAIDAAVECQIAADTLRRNADKQFPAPKTPPQPPAST